MDITALKEWWPVLDDLEPLDYDEPFPTSPFLRLLMIDELVCCPIKLLISTDGINRYAEYVQTEGVLLMKELLEEPQHFFGHLVRTSMSSILAIAHGERVLSSYDPFIPYHEKYLHESENLMGLRGVRFTALIPWLGKRLPDSLASWRVMTQGSRISSTGCGNLITLDKLIHNCLPIIPGTPVVT